jgi:hypothetical protein
MEPLINVNGKGDRNGVAKEKMEPLIDVDFRGIVMAQQEKRWNR